MLTTGTQWVEGRDAHKHSKAHDRFTRTILIWPKISPVPSLRKSAFDVGDATINNTGSGLIMDIETCLQSSNWESVSKWNNAVRVKGFKDSFQILEVSRIGPPSDA